MSFRKNRPPRISGGTGGTRYAFVAVGTAKIEHVRRELGDRFSAVDGVRLVIFHTDGFPGIADVMFIEKRSGRSRHRLFACPVCEKPKGLLYPDGNRGIGCAACLKKRTTRQLQHRNRAWGEGDETEDRIHRLLSRRGGITQAGLEKAQALADRLQAADLHKVDAMSLDIAAALNKGQKARGRNA